MNLFLESSLFVFMISSNLFESGHQYGTRQAGKDDIFNLPSYFSTFVFAHNY